MMRRSKIMRGAAMATVCFSAVYAPALLAQEPLNAYEQSLACKFSQTCDPETLQPIGAADEAEPSDDMTLEVGPQAPWKFLPTRKGQAAAPAASGGSAGYAQQRTGSSPKLYQPAGGAPKNAKVASAPQHKSSAPARKKVQPVFIRPKAADMTLEFANASAEVNSLGRNEIAAWARVLNSDGFADKVVRIEGHTDAVGARDYNLDLSKRRAEAVKELLIASGVAATRVEAVGFGFDKPRTEDPRRAENRRVEIVQAN